MSNPNQAMSPKLIMATPIPVGAHKVAHYYYGRGKEIQVFYHLRKPFIRDKNGDWPFDKVYGVRHRHPDEEDGQSADSSYETLGLYYEYSMPHTGWSGDC